MANEKWSSFPTQATPVAGDKLVGLHSGNNVQFTSLGAVLLAPSGDQTITGGYSLIVADTGNLQASSGNVIAGSSGLRGHMFVYPPTAGMGVFEIAAADSSAMYTALIINDVLSASRTWTFPNASGTVALTSQLPSSGSPLIPANGGTGVNNGTSTLTLAGNLATIGAFATNFTMSGATNVTFPTSGTLTTTSQASGIVNSALINQLAYYASAGSAVSGLATANNALLVTDGSGAPSIGSAIGADITVNNLTVGQGNHSEASNTNSAFGFNALSNNLTGLNNTAIGRETLTGITSGGSNIGIGSNVAVNNNGVSNIFLGSNSAPLLGTTTNGSYNLLIGTFTGSSGGNPGSVDFTGGSNNIWIGTFASGSSGTISGTIAIGALSVPDAATGLTSADFGPGIAIGSSYNPVGFRGDTTALPAGAANYWRMKINDTYYNLPILPDASTILWPSSGTLATTSQLPSSGTPLSPANGGTGISNSTNTLTINANSTINQDVSTGAVPSFAGISTSPAVSAASSLVIGAAYKNVLGYDIVLTVYLSVTAATAGNISLGVGSTTTPTQQTIVANLTTATTLIIPITIYLPNNYYALLSIDAGITATISGQQGMPV